VCGITGIFGNVLTHRIDQLLASTTLLAHRGPDGGGYWHEPPFAFGHRRLSIIDLSTGAQPMADMSGRYVITFNGEIYNYLELRSQLEALGSRFQTQSDTEVILEAYRHHGVETAAKLVGMFAFAIADRVNRTLYLARDRLGEKPLYVWTAPSGDTVFASELKSITSRADFACEVHPVALGGYLLLNYVPGEATLLRGVTRLPAGTWRLLNLDGRRSGGTYWTPASRETAGAGTPIDGAAAIDELACRLDTAVRIALRSDVPVTLFLSGGIDSSLVAESATRQGYLRHAYCLDFEDPSFSEWRNAKAVADRLGIELRRAVAGPIDPDAFARLVYHADDPLADSSAVAVDALSREVAKDYKVVVSGDGGDELFGGYLTYKATALYKALHRFLPAACTKSLARLLARAAAGGTKVSTAYKVHRFLRAWGSTPAVAHFTWNGTWLPEEATGLLTDTLRTVQPVDQALNQLIARTALAPLPELRSLQMADLLEYLPHDILTKVDRMTMAHGLECRAPFLNPAVAEFGVALEAREKVRLQGKPKRLLRALAQRIFPREISAAKKQGFSIPVHAWLRREMRDSLETFLSRERVHSMPFLDANAVLAHKNKHLAGTVDLGFELWGLMALSAWWRHHTRGFASSLASRDDMKRITFPPCHRANAPGGAGSRSGGRFDAD
jgi:asparagine synthase (glutamine-hydrolysing)